VGAIAYVEYARRLLPDPGESQDDAEINRLTAAMIPGNVMSLRFHENRELILTVVYWLVCFSIIVHGLSIPALNCIYKLLRVPVIQDHPVEVQLLSKIEPVPNNSVVNRRGHSMLLNNRFSRVSVESEDSFPSHHGREEPDVIMLRPNSQHCPGSPAGSSTKGSSHQVEHQAREVV
jgi:hypothetical protein